MGRRGRRGRRRFGRRGRRRGGGSLSALLCCVKKQPEVQPATNEQIATMMTLQQNVLQGNMDDNTRAQLQLLQQQQMQVLQQTNNGQNVDRETMAKIMEQQNQTLDQIKQMQTSGTTYSQPFSQQYSQPFSQQNTYWNPADTSGTSTTY